MASREQNERRFGQWDELPQGGRRYYYVRVGQSGGWVRYVKLVDAVERTLSFVQEVYDPQGRLLAVHQKHPVDAGHQWLSREGGRR